MTRNELIQSITKSTQIILGWQCAEPAGLRNKTKAQLEIAARKLARCADLTERGHAVEARYTVRQLDLFALIPDMTPGDLRDAQGWLVEANQLWDGYLFTEDGRKPEKSAFSPEYLAYVNRNRE